MDEPNVQADRPEKEPARPGAGDEAYRKQLEELQKIDFVLVELTLYLDTHPTDMQAIQQYNQLAQRRRQVCQDFEMRYGPLMAFGHSFSRFPWQWPETPWPWQV
ncbi:spore coat protein CotJB [Cohnella sp. CFH 77786]|uniref:spore coat protein CotJB n=1 Tax=Cohnella sp. CFH 77786 TaxID=2662265 RepID=UPI001C610346|nr:spore coat protein CotJB [Cohnella sp. CFH 77786]MBW5447794.1 spore coat protein CotJB [Cohnella sp. CFH 77786]